MIAETQAISSLGAVPYVEQVFTTGEVVGFVALIVSTQIVVTWMVGRSIKKLIIDSHDDVTNGILKLLSRKK